MFVGLSSEEDVEEHAVGAAVAGDDAEAALVVPVGPANGFVQQLEGFRLLAAGLVPEPLFIDGQPDVVEAQRRNQFNVLLREPLPPIRPAPPTLRKPVTDINPAPNLERAAL